ncbi:hypothetical protein OFN55_29835, partial [Escherichia coli]|nr:hypothetical protein [Escherichia coli]
MSVVSNRGGRSICLIVLTSCVPKQKNMPYALTQR